MRTVAFDTETHRIKPGQLTPRLVCLSSSEAGRLALLDRADALKWAHKTIPDPTVRLVGANTPYDLAVLAAEDPRLLRPIFEAYRDGRVVDVQLKQKMIDVARGERKFRHKGGKVQPATYNLAALTEYWLDEHLEKEATPRQDFHLYDGLPVSQYPADAVEYATKDALKTEQVDERQTAYVNDPHAIWARLKVPPVADEAHQNRAAWALHLMSVHGLRTDAPYVANLVSALQAERAEVVKELVKVGFMRPDGSRDMKKIGAAVEQWYQANGKEVPRTPTGKPKCDEETCGNTSHRELLIYAAGLENQTILANWVKHMEAGARHPLNPRYDSFLETGRTSAKDPPIQTPAKKGGVRESFVPRPGWLYAFADYDTIELRTLAKECEELVGFSAMADALRRGEDLHLAMCAQLMGIAYAEAKRRHSAGDVEVDEKRGLCKIANFGFPGGMVPDTFREYAAGFGVVISKKLAQDLYDTWLKSWPEMRKYFAIIKGMLGPHGVGTIVQSRSLRVRGDVRFCAACNTRFQGRAADGAKEALWNLAWECYLGDYYDGRPGRSPLYGCRPVLFMHDEVGMEIPPWADADAAARRLGEVMVESMSVWVQGIPVKAGPALMRRWYKGAKAVEVNGKLVPSRPEKYTEGGKSKVRWVADLAVAS